MTRNDILEELVQHLTDIADIDDLTQYYYDTKYDIFDELSTKELIAEYTHYLDKQPNLKEN